MTTECQRNISFQRQIETELIVGKYEARTSAYVAAKRNI